MDSNEIPLSEGDIVELRKIGSDGWWFVRHVVTGEEGWAPASYLESVKRRSSHSTLSMSSLGKVLTACVFPHSVCALTTYPLHLVLDNGYSPATPVPGEICLLGSCLFWILTIDNINNSLATKHLCSGNASHVSAYMIGYIRTHSDWWFAFKANFT